MLQTRQIYGAAAIKVGVEAIMTVEGDNDSWGGRSQRKWELMRNNKSSLFGLIVRPSSTLNAM